MRLTPEQREQARRAKEAGEKRVTIVFTDDQRREWEAAVQEELAGKEENIAHHRKIQAAAERTGFFGDLRRAIMHSQKPVHELASEIGVSARLLSDFRAGEADLPADSLGKLVETLGLQLVPEMPH